ncbi:putative aminophospholipid-translocase [Goodea atripinnis]|uniref:Aminophospholipid-translocase n=1 Tax=Goodea atripinnis TaxID=208336 RepID=A0ABV0P1I9_9TELE
MISVSAVLPFVLGKVNVVHCCSCSHIKSCIFSYLLSLSSCPPGSAAQPFSPFWFTVEPQDTQAIRGNSALLNCSVHSDETTPARIEWKKDGTFMSLVSDERRRILPDGSLFFAHVVHSKHNKPDEGTYQCVATIENLGSISSRTARLAVAGKG